MSFSTSQYAVAYLDILGAKLKMNNPKTCNLFLNVLYSLYDTVKGLAKGLADDVDTKFFSDNVVFAKKLDCPEMRESYIKDVLWYAAFFQSYAATGDTCCLLRGGITIGEFFVEKDLMIYGPALVKTYELESDSAKNPRIIIDPEKVSEFQSNRKIKDYLLEDSDGQYFLNHVRISAVTGNALYMGFEKIKRDAPREEDGSYKDSEGKKLDWYMRYVNKELDRSGTDKERLSL
jgi:hypothetical protein